jgi:hypothetical protein
MKTALNWLVDELKSRYVDLSKWNEDLILEAKKMEKQQILDAYNSGDQNGVTSMIDGYGMMDSEEYYNEMFKKEENE